MKKLSLLLLFLVSFITSFSQSYQQQTIYGVSYKRIQVRDGLNIPVTDSLLLNSSLDTPGSIKIRIKDNDTAIWFYAGSSRWYRLQNSTDSSSGGGGGMDTAYLNSTFVKLVDSNNIYITPTYINNLLDTLPGDGNGIYSGSGSLSSSTIVNGGGSYGLSFSNLNGFYLNSSNIEIQTSQNGYVVSGDKLFGILDSKNGIGVSSNFTSGNSGILLGTDYITSSFTKKQQFQDKSGFIALLEDTTFLATKYDLLSYVPKNTTITINGVTQDLSTNRSWTVSGGGGADTNTNIGNSDLVINTGVPDGERYLYLNENNLNITGPGNIILGNDSTFRSNRNAKFQISDLVQYLEDGVFWGQIINNNLEDGILIGSYTWDEDGTFEYNSSLTIHHQNGFNLRWSSDDNLEDRYLEASIYSEISAEPTISIYGSDEPDYGEIVFHPMSAEGTVNWYPQPNKDGYVAFLEDSIGVFATKYDLSQIDGSATIYTANGSLLDDREIDGNGNRLEFSHLDYFSLHTYQSDSTDGYITLYNTYMYDDGIDYNYNESTIYLNYGEVYIGTTNFYDPSNSEYWASSIQSNSDGIRLSTYNTTTTQLTPIVLRTRNEGIFSGGQVSLFTPFDFEVTQLFQGYDGTIALVEDTLRYVATKWELSQISGGGGIPSNLSLGILTSTQIPINNSNGTGVTLPSANGSTAGLLTAALYTKLVGIDGSETIINPGTNVTITGLGTVSNPYIINSTGGSGGSGTVASGLANRLGYYESNGTTISPLPAITPGRLLISNSNGLPTHSLVTSTEVSYLQGITSSVQTQLNNKSNIGHSHNVNTLTGVGSNGQVPISNGSSLIMSTPPWLTAEVDGSVTNELQTLSISNDTLFISSGNYIVLPGGGSTSGTINFGNANRLAYYAANGTTISNLAAITAGRALVSNLFGLPVASLTSTTELEYLVGVTSSVQGQLNTKQTQLNGFGFVKANGTTITYDNTTYVPTSRTITINGVTQDLSVNRTFTVSGGGGGVTEVFAGGLVNLFTTTVNNSTTTPNIVFTPVSVGANTYFGNSTSVSGVPTFNNMAALTRINDTNVTLSLSGNPAASLLKNVQIQVGWVGTLPIHRGGTNLNTLGSPFQVLRVNAAGTALEYANVSSGSAVWGTITGTLSAQTDLQNALNAKQNQLNGFGFVKANGTTITYDNSTYLTAEVDGSVTNELQTLSKLGSTVTLSNGGGSFTDENTTYSGSTSINLTGGNSFERAALTGEVTAPANSNTLTITNGAVTDIKISSVSWSKITGYPGESDPFYSSNAMPYTVAHNRGQFGGSSGSNYNSFTTAGTYFCSWLGNISGMTNGPTLPPPATSDMFGVLEVSQTPNPGSLPNSYSVLKQELTIYNSTVGATWSTKKWVRLRLESSWGGWQELGGSGGGSGVSSVNVAGSGALSFTGGPITSSGTISASWGGSTAQYVRGDGSLASFPSIPTSANYIENQYSGPQTSANHWVSGNSRAAALVVNDNGYALRGNGTYMGVFTDPSGATAASFRTGSLRIGSSYATAPPSNGLNVQGNIINEALGGGGNRVVFTNNSGLLSASDGSANFILNQISTAQTANGWISGEFLARKLTTGTGSNGNTTLTIEETSLTSGNSQINTSKKNEFFGTLLLQNLGGNITMSHSTGIVKLANLTGASTRMLTVSTDGTIGAQAIPSSGTVTSVQVAGSGALNFSGGPITTSGTISASWGGSTGQYVRGDGSLATFPTIPTSGDYIQNQNAINQTANFRISGNGTLGGVLQAGIVNGNIRLESTGPTQSGYLSIYYQGTTRVGYIGFDPTNIEYAAETGSHIFGAPNASTGTPIVHIKPTNTQTTLDPTLLVGTGSALGNYTVVLRNSSTDFQTFITAGPGAFIADAGPGDGGFRITSGKSMLFGEDGVNSWFRINSNGVNIKDGVWQTNGSNYSSSGTDDAKILVRNQSTGKFEQLTIGTNLSITGSTLNATGGGGGSNWWTETTNFGEYIKPDASTIPFVPKGIYTGGGYASNKVRITSNYTVADTIEFIYTFNSTASYDIILPPPSEWVGRVLSIRNANSNTSAEIRFSGSYFPYLDDVTPLDIIYPLKRDNGINWAEIMATEDGSGGYKWVVMKYGSI